jgi:hypothetical protein
VLRTEKFFYNWEGEDVGLEPTAEVPAARQDDEEPAPGPTSQ